MNHAISMFRGLASAGLVLALGCESGPPADGSKAAVAAPGKAAPVKVTPGEMPPPLKPALLAKFRDQLEQGRELHAAYRAGTLGDRLVADKLLLIDAKAPADTDQARYFVFTGKLPAPADFAALEALKATAEPKVKELLHGGEDSERVALVRDIEPGAYTVCAVLSGPTDPAKTAHSKRAEEAFVAGGGELSPENIKAAADKAKAETGHEVAKIEWSARPVRCNIAEVTADPNSRVVVVG